MDENGMRKIKVTLYKNAVEKCDEKYVFYTGESSKVLRQLAFGEGALFWFFTNHQCPMTNIAEIGLSILVLYFVVDSLQYIIGAIKHNNKGRLYRRLCKEKVSLENEDIGKDELKGTNVCFILKIIALIGASVFLVSIFICNFSDNVSSHVATCSCSESPHKNALDRQINLNYENFNLNNKLH